jgi:hypothetical protein
VIEAARQKVSMREAMGMTGRRSLATFLRYFQADALLATRVANRLKKSD